MKHNENGKDRIAAYQFFHSVWPHLFRGAGHEKRRGEQFEVVPGI